MKLTYIKFWQEQHLYAEQGQTFNRRDKILGATSIDKISEVWLSNEIGFEVFKETNY